LQPPKLFIPKKMVEIAARLRFERISVADNYPDSRTVCSTDVRCSWVELGKWAVEVKTGGFDAQALRGLLEFCRRNPAFTPLVICAPGEEEIARRHVVLSVSWEDFLISGPAQG
jgi:hypothetical protein